MKKKIKEYIDALCDEYGMDDNKQAKKMLVNDFIAIYEEWLKEYDKNCEKAFLKAKELFGTKAIIDKTYRISHNYGYYNKMKKAYVYLVRFIIALIFLTSVYGIAFAKTSDSKINTLLLWVTLIVLVVAFVIIAESTNSKINKIFNQLNGKLEYFYVKTNDKTLFNIFKERYDKENKEAQLDEYNKNI